jgi:phosphopantothenoylcysteine decarboxylase/phosphopantothenate--cysteine ligase
MAAAVADYRPTTAAAHKIKKQQADLTLSLARTPDILVAVTAQREESGFPHVVIGFAAETQDLLENARAKLSAKRLDLIVANDVTAADAGFARETNRVLLIGRDGSVEQLPLMSKAAVAKAVLKRVGALLTEDEGGRTKEE